MTFQTVTTMFPRTRHVINAYAMKRKEVIAMHVRQTTFIVFSWVVKFIYHKLSSLMFEQKQNMSCNNHLMCCYARNDSAR